MCMSIEFVAVSSTATNSIDIHMETLTENTEVRKQIKGAQMHYFDLTVPSNWGKKDLIVESELSKEKELVTSPLVIISLEPLSNTSSEKQWICNQLGGETCFLPAKYLKPERKVYLGVFCKNCEYSLKYLFASETKIKLGETTMFHLKKGDSKVFDLTFSDAAEFKDYVNISSFNMRMSKYSMNVQIENQSDQKADPVEANVVSNWIGGQQALIYPKNLKVGGSNSEAANIQNYSFKIVIVAHESGVFNLEATSGNTIITLGSSNIRFDSTSKEAPICYSFETSGDNNIVAQVKSINGDLTVLALENKLPEFDDYSKKFTVENEREEKVKLLSRENVKKWFLCVESEKSAYYSIHIFNEGHEDKVQLYKNLLYSLLKTKEMYSINNMHGYNRSYAKRVLAVEDEEKKEEEKEEEKKDDEDDLPDDTLLITGNGMAGILVTFLLIGPVLLMIGVMNSTFVNTKLVEKPLLVGKIDS